MFSLKEIKFKKILYKDLKEILRWRNSNFIRSKMLNQKKITYKVHLGWYKDSMKDKTNKNYLIYYKSEKIGVASIKRIDFINQNCTWGYYIAIPSFRYLALLVEYKFIDFIFKKFKIRKIWGEALKSNKKILKIHKYLGFDIEGIYKNHIKVNNKFEDVILISMFKKNWKKYNNKLILRLKKLNLL